MNYLVTDVYENAITKKRFAYKEDCIADELATIKRIQNKSCWECKKEINCISDCKGNDFECKYEIPKNIDMSKKI